MKLGENLENSVRETNGFFHILVLPLLPLFCHLFIFRKPFSMAPSDKSQSLPEKNYHYISCFILKLKTCINLNPLCVLFCICATSLEFSNAIPENVVKIRWEQTYVISGIFLMGSLLFVAALSHKRTEYLRRCEDFQRRNFRWCADIRKLIALIQS